MDWYVDTMDPSAVRDLRREVAAFLRRHAEPSADLSAAELAVAELLANAAEHAGGSAWVSLTWGGKCPTLTVCDLGPGFELPRDLPDELAEGGRGLFIVSSIVNELTVAARSGGGAKVTAILPVSRPPSPSYDPPRRSRNPLPTPDEASPDGFGRESFLRALVVEMAQSVEELQGPAVAEAAIAQVGIDIGSRMEQEYRSAKDVKGSMSTAQLADCLVRLKHAIEGGFYVVEATEGRIVLGNTRCPFGEVVRNAPALCRMTSSVFGGIAAHQHPDGSAVFLEERIAVGDPGCKVVVYFGAGPTDLQDLAHRYHNAG